VTLIPGVKTRRFAPAGPADMFGLNYFELLPIAAVAVLLFGSRLPIVAQSLRRSIEEFRRGLHVDEAIDRRAKQAVGSSSRDLLIVVVAIAVAVLLAIVLCAPRFS
jgi:hypothetical protein